MEDIGLDFSKMESESKEIIDSITTPEFNVGETLQEAEELRGRISELSQKFGEKFDIQRPEIQEAIASLPRVGIELKRDENGEVERGQEIGPENLVFVRVTDYMPIERDGQRVVETSYNATKETEEPIFRLTTHWTANHVVHNHIMGEFEGRMVTIIAPAQQMLVKNGAPFSMLPVDTFWKEDVIVPDNSIILTYGAEAGEGVINLTEEDDSEEIAKLVLQAMGYTTVTDHPTYTETGFDLGLVELAKKIGSEALLHIDIESKETAIENFFHPPLISSGYDHYLKQLVGYWSEIPAKIQEAVIDKVEEMAQMDIDVEKKHDLYNAIDIVLQEDDKYPIELVRNFITGLSTETLIDFVSNECQYWNKKESEEISYMKEFYIKNLSKYLDEPKLNEIVLGLKDLQ